MSFIFDTSTHLKEPSEDLLHILFVDDEEAILSAFRRNFKKKPYKAHFARNGDEALEILQAHDFDVVVTDLSMPGMDGFELIRQINRSFPDLIKIVLSGQTEKQDVVNLFNDGGIEAYLDKPWEMDELRQRISLAVRKRNYERIANSEIHQKLVEYRQIAGVDELTKTAAPQKLEAFLLDQIETARRYGVPFSLIMLELDNSDWIIDNEGEAFYTELLRKAAVLIEQRMRILDLLGRWEESRMLLVSPHTDLKSAMIFAEDLRLLIEQHDFDYAMDITARLGVCTYDDKKLLRYEMIASAYKSLLLAQDSGGNSVITQGEISL